MDAIGRYKDHEYIFVDYEQATNSCSAYVLLNKTGYDEETKVVYDERTVMPKTYVIELIRVPPMKGSV